jgi:hypothetical protein
VVKSFSVPSVVKLFFWVGATLVALQVEQVSRLFSHSLTAETAVLPKWETKVSPTLNDFCFSLCLCAFVVNYFCVFVFGLNFLSVFVVKYFSAPSAPLR